MSYLWVALGGALGSTSRYAVGRAVARFVDGDFPWSTLIVNVSGSLLIGFLAGLVTVEGRPSLSPEARAFVLIGILGGFTTFSSFSLQTFALFNDGEWLAAAVNIVASVALCMLGVWLGHTVGVQLNR